MLNTIVGRVPALRGILRPVSLILTLAIAGCGSSSPVTYDIPVAPGAGELLSAEPMTAFLLPGVPLPARAWKITYRSTTARGASREVSGMVLVPDAPYEGGERPLVGYAIGTHGMADRCANSNKLAAGLMYEVPVLAQVLAQGWAVALTDYPGLNAPGTHPYIVGRALGPAVLDSMRAARQLKDAGLSPNGPLALFGYSEGGNGAAWAAEMQPRYAPDLPLMGAALGGIPADLERDAEAVDGTPTFWLQFWVAAGLDSEYPELKLDSYLNDLGRATVAQFNDLCVEEAVPLGAAISLVAGRRERYFVQDPLLQPDWIARVRENRLGSVAPQTPVLMQHAPLDEAVAYAPSRTLYQEWCALGVNVRFRSLPGEHVIGGLAAAGPAIDFLTERFAGKPLDAACTELE